MAYFGLKRWDFSNDNVIQLSRSIDQSPWLTKELQFHGKTVDWEQFFCEFIPGVQKFYYKVTSGQVHEKGRKMYRRLKFYHDSMKILLWCLLPIIGGYKARGIIRRYLHRFALNS